MMASAMRTPAPAANAGDGVLVRTEALSKRFGRRLVVNQINLEVHRGDVYGLLGPNGSGKTTTLRMLLGLVWPTAGRIQLFGRDMADGSQRQAALRRVGAIVEQPSFYPFLSGRDNLAGVATFAGLASDAHTRARITSVLEQVGLGDRAQDTYKKYSLGMKQRLGIAAALLTDPEMVLLDEPTNGLDPAGMVEVRALITQLARRGTTVLLSSHLLHEVQQVCTRVAVLKEGQLLAQGLVAELVRTAGGGGVQLAFREPDEYVRAVEVLRGAQEGGASWLNGARYVSPEPGSPPPPGGWFLLVNTAPDRAAEVNQLLATNGLYAAEVRRREDSLEQFFLALTGTMPSSLGAAPVPPAQAGSAAEATMGTVGTTGTAGTMAEGATR